MGFIDGSIERPKKGEPFADQWETVNATIVIWLFGTLEPELLNTVSSEEDPKKLWDELAVRYGQGNRTTKYRLRSEICLLRQEGRTVTDYYYKLKGLWEELETHLWIPACNEDATQLFAEREEEKSFKFLMGLNQETFGTVVSNIIGMDPLPNFSKVFSLVLNEEQQRIVSRVHETVQ